MAVNKAQSLNPQLPANTGPVPQHPARVETVLTLPITSAKLVTTTGEGGVSVELALTFTAGGTITIPAYRT